MEVIGGEGYSDGGSGGDGNDGVVAVVVMGL